MSKRQCAWNESTGRCQHKCGYTMEPQPDDTQKRVYNTFCDKHQYLVDTMESLVISDNEDDNYEFPREFLEHLYHSLHLIMVRNGTYTLTLSFSAVERERRLQLICKIYSNWLKEFKRWQ